MRIPRSQASDSTTMEWLRGLDERRGGEYAQKPRTSNTIEQTKSPRERTETAVDKADMGCK